MTGRHRIPVIARLRQREAPREGAGHPGTGLGSADAVCTPGPAWGPSAGRIAPLTGAAASLTRKAIRPGLPARPRAPSRPPGRSPGWRVSSSCRATAFTRIPYGGARYRAPLLHVRRDRPAQPQRGSQDDVEHEPQRGAPCRAHLRGRTRQRCSPARRGPTSPAIREVSHGATAGLVISATSRRTSAGRSPSACSCLSTATHSEAADGKDRRRRAANRTARAGLLQGTVEAVTGYR